MGTRLGDPVVRTQLGKHSWGDPVGGTRLEGPCLGDLLGVGATCGTSLEGPGLGTWFGDLVVGTWFRNLVGLLFGAGWVFYFTEISG